MKRTCNVMVVVLSILISPGCGGDDSDEFRTDYNAAVASLAKINTDIGAAAGDSRRQSNAAIAREFSQIADTATQTRSDLARLEPPGDAEKQFDELLSALEKGVGDLRSVARSAKSSNPEQYNRAVKELARSGRDITAAENALKKAVDR